MEGANWTLQNVQNRKCNVDWPGAIIDELTGRKSQHSEATNSQTFDKHLGVWVQVKWAEIPAPCFTRRGDFW